MPSVNPVLRERVRLAMNANTRGMERNEEGWEMMRMGCTFPSEDLKG